LTFWGGGFGSEAEARASGAPVKVALTIAGVILGAGIDVGSDQVLSTAAKRTDGLPDDRLQPDIHGLQVVPELEGMIFGFLRFDRQTVRITPESLQKAVMDYYSLKVELTKKQILAAQLYNQSHFNSTDTARFLTLISVVEVLSERRLRSTDAQKLIDQMIELTKSVKSPDMDSLRSSLSDLKQESIGSACRFLVKKHCGDIVNAKDFSRFYTIRSVLVHRGEPPEGTDFPQEIRRLDGIVRHLICGHIVDSQQSAHRNPM